MDYERLRIFQANWNRVLTPSLHSVHKGLPRVGMTLYLSTESTWRCGPGNRVYREWFQFDHPGVAPAGVVELHPPGGAGPASGSAPWGVRLSTASDRPAPGTGVLGRGTEVDLYPPPGTISRR